MKKLFAILMILSLCMFTIACSSGDGGGGDTGDNGDTTNGPVEPGGDTTDPGPDDTTTPPDDDTTTPPDDTTPTE
jgi:hypothetical protein